MHCLIRRRNCNNNNSRSCCYWCCCRSSPLITTITTIVVVITTAVLFNNDLPVQGVQAAWISSPQTASTTSRPFSSTTISRTSNAFQNHDRIISKRRIYSSTSTISPSSFSRTTSSSSSSSSSSRRSSSTALHAVLISSLLAGSIAGAVGVGVAYPLDTLKTKQQVMAGNHETIFHLIHAIYQQEGIAGFYNGVRSSMIGQGILKAAAFSTNAMALQYLQEHEQQQIQIPIVSSLLQNTSNDFLFTTSYLLSDTECLILAAMFSGFVTSFLVVPIERIKVMMQSQTIPPPDNIADAQIMIQQQQQMASTHHSTTTTSTTGITVTASSSSVGAAAATATATAGVTSTGTATMTFATTSSGTASSGRTGTGATTASSTGTAASTSNTSTSTAANFNNDNDIRFYKNEIECLQAVLKNEGLHGLMFRGLTPTIAREVPRYAIYFAIYGVLMQCTLFVTTVGPIAPLIGGALAGCLSWLPVYPTDVVKTIIQNTEGGSGDNATTTNAFQIGKELFDSGGFEGFYDGITPKLLRAAVINAVTFFMYDSVLDFLSSSTNIQ